MTDPTPTFTADQLARLEAALRQRRAELDRRLAALQDGGSRAEHAAEVLAQDGDDAPQRDADREVDLARNDWMLAELGAVAEALAHLHDPGFGTCTDCGEPMAFERLRVEPWARRCVGCQTRAEAR